MLASGDQLLELIPHRSPVIMVDELLSCEGRFTRTGLIIRDVNVFVMNGVLTEAGLIEMMAQAAAAGTGWRLREQKGKDLAIPAGAIGAVKNYRQIACPPVNAYLVAEVEVLYEMEGASVIRGSVFWDEEMIAQCEMNVFFVDR